MLSIVGPGRSGTTILAGILGEADGMVNVGELRWLWRRGFVEHRSCGCGLPPDECPVWSKVAAQTLSGRSETPAEIVAAQAELTRRRNRLRVIRSARGGDDDWRPLATVRAVTAPGGGSAGGPGGGPTRGGPGPGGAGCPAGCCRPSPR